VKDTTRKDNSNSNAVANQPVQKKNNGRSMAPPSSGPPVVQRVIEDVIVTENTRIRKNDGGKPMGKSLLKTTTIGEELKPNDLVTNVNTDVESEGYYTVRKGDEVGWIKMTSVMKASALRGAGKQDAAGGDLFEGSKADDSWEGETAGDFGETADDVSGGLENTWLKGVDGKGGIQSNLMVGHNKLEKNDDGTDKLEKGSFGDLEKKPSDIEKGKNSMDVVSGAGDLFSSLFAMKKAVGDFAENEGWERFAAGGDFVESLAKGAAGTAKMIDSGSKAHGHSEGIGKSDLGGKFTGAISDGVSAVKNALLGVVGLIKLKGSKSSEKGKEAAESMKSLTEAALSAAKVAKTAYDIIGNGIPPAIITTIPALSIAVSGINLLIKFADALSSGDAKTDMSAISDPLRTDLMGEFGETEDAPKVFHKESRGTFPAYKDYYRIKEEKIVAIEEAHDAGVNAAGGAEQADPAGADFLSKKGEFDTKVKELESAKTQKAEGDKIESQWVAHAYAVLKEKGIESPEYKEAYKGWMTAKGYKVYAGSVAEKAEGDKAAAEGAAGTAEDRLVVSAVKKRLGATPGTVPFKNIVTGKGDVSKLKTLSEKMRKYEVADKMSEINQKRQVGSWTEVSLELVNIAADIATLSGVGAIVGAAMKGVVAGGKVAHGAAKAAQQWSRNKAAGKDGKVDKSTKAKHAEYVRHTKQIFKMISGLPEPTGKEAPDVKEAQQKQYSDVMSILAATGVNTGLLFVLTDPKKQAEKIVEAMKSR
jgi:hypothetical protein